MKNKKLYIALGIVALAVGLVGVSYWFVNQNAPDVVNVTNVTSSSATITWVTTDPEPGKVIVSERSYPFPIVPVIGNDTEYYDDRDLSAWELENTTGKPLSSYPELSGDELGNYYTHHVTVVDLDPEKNYHFMVGSGNFYYKVSGHDGLNSFKTMAVAEEVNTPDPAYGKVYLTGESITDQTALVDGLVYLYVENSFGAVVSSRVSTTLNSEGSWYLDLNTVYNTDGELFFPSVPTNEISLYKEVIEVYAPDGEIYQKKISPAEDAPAADMVLIEEYKVERRVTGQPLFSGLASSTYAWDLTCPNGKKLHADASDEASFIAIYGAAQAQSKWEQEASGYCNDADTPSWQEGQPTVQLTDEVCPVSYQETGAFGANDGCVYNCVGMGRKTTGGDCKNEWGPGSYCQKADPKCGTVCDGGEVCKEGDFCVSGDYQCCTSGCNVRSSEGSSSGSSSGGTTNPGDGNVCKNKKPEGVARCGDDNDCDEGQWCGDLDAKSCKCGKGTVQCGTQCTKAISDGTVSNLVCCNSIGTTANFTYENSCPSGFNQVGMANCPARTSTAQKWVCCGTGINGSWSTNCQLPLITIADSLCKLPQPATIPAAGTTAPPLANPAAPTSTCTVAPGQDCNNCKGQTGEIGGVTYLCTDYGAAQTGHHWTPVVKNGESCPTGEYCICAREGFVFELTIGQSRGGVCGLSNNQAASLTPISKGSRCPTSTTAGCFCDSDDTFWTLGDVTVSAGEYCGKVGACNASNVGSVCNDNGQTCAQTSLTSMSYLDPDTNSMLTVSPEECEDIPACANFGYAPPATFACNGPAAAIDAEPTLIASDQTAVLGATIGKSVTVSPTENAVAIEDSGVYCTTVDSERYCFQMTSAVNNTLYVDVNANGTYDEGTDILVSQDGRELTLEQATSSFNYSISEGFTFVSFPFVNSAYLTNASTLLAYLNGEYNGNFYSIAKFESGRWRIVGNREGEGFGSEDFPIVPGEGYLLKAKTDMVISLNGQRITDPVPVAVATGWNLLGVHNGTDDTKYTAESLIDDMNTTEGLTAVNISRWAAIKAKYEGLQKEEVDGTAQVYGFDFPIYSSESYFVRIVEGSGTWTPKAQ